MENPAAFLIKALGGTTAVSRLTEAPVSTVHSWTRNGIPQSRLAHLRLAAKAARVKVDFDTLARGVTPDAIALGKPSASTAAAA